MKDTYRVQDISIRPLMSAYLMSPATQSLTSAVDAKSGAIAGTRLRRVGRESASLGSVVLRSRESNTFNSPRGS
jgi:hypothetical protein